MNLIQKKELDDFNHLAKLKSEFSGCVVAVEAGEEFLFQDREDCFPSPGSSTYTGTFVLKTNVPVEEKRKHSVEECFLGQYEVVETSYCLNLKAPGDWCIIQNHSEEWSTLYIVI